MGHGAYSSVSHCVRASSMGYYTKSTSEVFAARSINNAMNPNGVKIRESRDSADHPESLAIVIALDVTGSMGSVPHFLVKDGLPKIMEAIMASGVKHPQILFLGIGDHTCDQAPLQVGQFESSDALLDKWLTSVYLEGGGGSNDGESYCLAWYFAASHTAIDCLEKRGRKGLLFTIGDEPVLTSVRASEIKRIMGDGQYEDSSAAELFRKASDKYECYHINIKETPSGGRPEVYKGWKQMISNNLKVADRREDIARIIAETVTGVATTGVRSATASREPEEIIL